MTISDNYINNNYYIVNNEANDSKIDNPSDKKIDSLKIPKILYNTRFLPDKEPKHLYVTTDKASLKLASWYNITKICSSNRVNRVNKFINQCSAINQSQISLLSDLQRDNFYHNMNLLRRENGLSGDSITTVMTSEFKELALILHSRTTNRKLWFLEEDDQIFFEELKKAIDSNKNVSVENGVKDLIKIIALRSYHLRQLQEVRKLVRKFPTTYSLFRRDFSILLRHRILERRIDKQFFQTACENYDHFTPVQLTPSSMDICFYSPKKLPYEGLQISAPNYLNKVRKRVKIIINLMRDADFKDNYLDGCVKTEYTIISIFPLTIYELDPGDKEAPKVIHMNNFSEDTVLITKEEAIEFLRSIKNCLHFAQGKINTDKMTFVHDRFENLPVSIHCRQGVIRTGAFSVLLSILQEGPHMGIESSTDDELIDLIFHLSEKLATLEHSDTDPVPRLAHRNHFYTFTRPQFLEALRMVAAST